MEPTIRTHPMITRSITRELQEQDAEADFVRNAMALMVTLVNSDHGEAINIILNSIFEQNTNPLDNRIIILTTSISLPID